MLKKQTLAVGASHLRRHWGTSRMSSCALMAKAAYPRRSQRKHASARRRHHETAPPAASLHASGDKWPRKTMYGARTCRETRHVQMGIATFLA